MWSSSEMYQEYLSLYAWARVECYQYLVSSYKNVFSSPVATVFTIHSSALNGNL